jgi:glycine oxidase
VPDDVVVVGAGPWGLGAAWRLAERGARVRVLDDGGQPAAWVAAGMLAPWSEATEGEEELHRVMRTAATRWPAFADELGRAAGRGAGHHRTGALVVAARPEHLGPVRRLCETLGRVGPTPDWTSGSDLRDLEPGLATAVAGGLVLPEEHQADPRELLAALRAACAAAGVQVEGIGAEALLRDSGGRVTGVRRADGTELLAGRVVLAAGWASGRLSRRVPVRPVKGQILLLAPRPGADAPIARIVRTPVVYLVPRSDGRVVVGATVEEAADRMVMAGAVHELLDEAVHVVPDVRELVLAEALVGLRPATPDNLPALGEDPEDGLIWATGGFRHGIVLTPLAGEAAAAAAAGEPVDPTAERFSPTRFAVPAAVP